MPHSENTDPRLAKGPAIEVWTRPREPTSPRRGAVYGIDEHLMSASALPAPDVTMGSALAVWR